MSDHRCPAPDCEARVPHSMLACRHHYGLLPKPLRNKLYRTWRDGAGAGTLQHDEAIRACVNYWRATKP